MHLAVVNHNAYVASVAAGKRTMLDALHYALEDGRHKACVDGTTNYRIDEYQLAAPLEINLFTALDVNLKLLTIYLVRYGIGHSFCVRLHNHVNLAELTSTTRLLLVTILGTRHLCDGLAIRDACRLKLDSQLLVVLQSPL